MPLPQENDFLSLLEDPEGTLTGQQFPVQPEPAPDQFSSLLGQPTAANQQFPPADVSQNSFLSLLEDPAAPPQQEDPKQGSVVPGLNDLYNHPFLSALDYLNTPQQAIAGGLEAAVSGKPIGQGAIEGMRSNKSLTDVLKAGGVPELGSVEVPVLGKVTGRGTVGLAADMILDPMNLVGFGWLTKPLKGLTKTPKAIVRGIIRAQETKAAGRSALAVAKYTRNNQAALELSEKMGVSLEDLNQQILSHLEAKPVQGELSELVPEFEALKEGFKAGEPAATFKKADAVSGPQALPPKAKPEQLSLLGMSPSELRKMAAGRQLRKEMNVGEEMGPLFDANMGEDLAQLADRGNAIAKAPPPLAGGVAELTQMAEMVAELRHANDSSYMKEIITGLNTPKFDSVGIDYFLHALTDEAKKLISNTPSMKKLGRKFNPRHASQLAREFENMTVHEINASAQKGLLPGFKGITFNKFLVDDANALLALRTIRAEKAISDAQVLLQSAFRVGKLKEDVADPGLWRELVPLAIASNPDPRFSKLNEVLKLYKFDPEVGTMLNAWSDSVFNPQSPNALDKAFKIFDQVQGMWKESTLFVFPAYHSRNFVGNLWNNWVAGLGDPGYYKKAYDYMHKTDPESVLQVAGKEFTKEQFDNILADFGITGQFAEYMSIKPTVRKGLEKVASLDKRTRIEKWPVIGKGVSAGKWVGENLVEGNARLAHFMWRLDKGDDLAKAASSVKKHLFDYGDLTEVEKLIVRRVFPFYTWVRKNVPLQLQMMVEKPGKYQPIGDIINTFENNVPGKASSDEDQLIANWMMENSAVKVRRDEKGNPEYFLLGGWLPAADIDKLTGPVNELKSQLSPLAKVPIEMLTNKSMYFGNDLEKFPGEKGKFLGMNLGKKSINALKNIRVLAEADRLLAMAQEGTDWKFSERKGEDLVPYVARVLFGMKIYVNDLQKSRRVRRYKVLENRRQLRNDMRKNEGRNKEILDAQMQELLGRGQ